MRHLLTILAALLFCAAPAQAQTLKSLMYNTTNGQVLYTGTNSLRFVDSVAFSSDVFGFSFEAASGSNYTQVTPDGVEFSGAAQRATTRTNLGLGATWLTNTNVSNFRAALGLGENNSVVFGSVNAALSLVDLDDVSVALQYDSSSDQWWIEDTENFRLRLGLSESDIVTFAGLTNSGNITINQTATNNGLLYIRRTNNEPFLGLANLIASNNTTLSNETLFRVGRAEATNQAAQFGFRVVRTNNGGEGFATFSVFGYNALMMVGPSDRSRTNTATNAGIEAEIYTITGSNRVMTLRDTNSGALTLHQDLGFGAGLTNTAPTNTNTPTVWLRVWVGTNNYRLPLYQ